MLPQKLSWDLAQTQWASSLNPLIANVLNSVNILEGVALTTGANVINHRLGRKQQGWFLTDINASAKVYRSAAFNALTLTLTTDADCVVNLGVF